MSSIEALLNLDFKSFGLMSFIFLFGIVAIVELLCRIADLLGKPIGYLRGKKQDHDLLIETTENLKELKKQHTESVNQSIRHDDMLRNDITALKASIKTISIQLIEMQRKQDEAEVANMRDRLIQYYRKFQHADSWSRLEKDAFENLLKEYENRGGDGYIHSVVLPVMEELKVID